METIKSFTDIEQSKKLAEILPIESADMYYTHEFVNSAGDYYKLNIASEGYFDNEELLGSDIPCWSLAALLGVLDYPQLSKNKLGSGKEGWMVSVYPNDCRYDSCWHDNPIDACYEMIIKLKEQKLL